MLSKVLRIVIAFVLLIVVVVICGALIGLNMFSDKAMAQFFANMPRPVITVSAVEVKPTTWSPGINAVGTVAASQGVDVAVQAGGIVEKILFKANDKVEAGQLLVQIDDAVERANLGSAQTSVAVAQEALTRAQQLLDRKVGTVAALQDAQNNLDKAKGTLQQLEATIDQKAIKAPFAGTIGIARIDVGQYVQPATVVATLQNLDTMKVNFTVPEQQLGALKIGQSVQFGMESGNLPYKGAITGIDPKIDPASRLVSVQAEVSNSDGALRPGMFIHVRIELPVETDVIALPQTAVTISLYGTYVYVIEKAPPPAAKPADANAGAAAAQPAPPPPEFVAKQVFVQTGRRSGDTIEIIKGVTPGELIATSGQNKLSPGSPVAIDKDGEPPEGAVQPAGAVQP